MSCLATRIAGSTRQAIEWLRARPAAVIDNEAEASAAAALRAQLAVLKQQAEDARDAERLPLIAKAQEITAAWAPRLAAVKRADDVLRHALRAFESRRKSGKRTV